MDAQSGEFVDCAVPIGKRYGPWSMGLLWLTMVTGFPPVIIGFEWSKAGYSLWHVLAGAGLSCVILLVYTVAASYVGARTGLNFPLLCRVLFGKRFSQIISLLQSVLFFLWYSLIAVFVAMELNELVCPNIPIAAIAFFAAVVMSANNIFGFAGVANFARFLAAPLLALWICGLFLKCCLLLPPAMVMAPAQAPFLVSLSGVSSFIIGYAVWGNEPDFWRFGKPNLSATALPLLVAVMLGQIISPVAGWMVAHLARAQAAAAATTSYSFGPHPLLAAAILTIAYFATADANMYGGINAVQNFVSMPRRKLVFILVIVTAFAAAFLANCANAFQVLANLNSVLLPCVTVIIVTEVFIVGRWQQVLPKSAAPEFALQESAHLIAGAPNLSKASQFSAIFVLLFAWSVGVVSSGVIPGTQSLRFGIWPLYAWLTAALTHLALRWFQLRGKN